MALENYTINEKNSQGIPLTPWLSKNIRLMKTDYFSDSFTISILHCSIMRQHLEWFRQAVALKLHWGFIQTHPSISCC